MILKCRHLRILLALQSARLYIRMCVLQHKAGIKQITNASCVLG